MLLLPPPLLLLLAPAPNPHRHRCGPVVDSSVFESGRRLWGGESRLNPTNGWHVDMQYDGNVVLFDGSGTPRWAYNQDANTYPGQ